MVASEGGKHALSSRFDVPRHIEREPPGSGSHNVRKEGNDAERFIMNARQFVPIEPKGRSPGPAAYRPTGAAAASQYTKILILTRFPEPKRDPGLGYSHTPPADTGLKLTIGKRLNDALSACHE
jgi:hypothetical protein